MGGKWGYSRKCLSKNHKKIKVKISIILLFLIFISSFIYIEGKIEPIIEIVARQKAYTEIVRVINLAARTELEKGVSYDDLVNIHKNSKGEILMLQSNAVEITKLSTKIGANIEDLLDNISVSRIEIPMGLLTGITLFANIGPKIKVVMQPIGSANINTRDYFEAVGINQSRHIIKLNAKVEIGLLLPFTKTVMEVEKNLPLVESIIIGPVPNTYLDSKGFAK